MQDFVLFGTVYADVLGGAVIGYLVVKLRQLGHFDKIAETLFLYNIVRYRKFVIGRFFGINRRPRVKRTDVLFFQCFGAKVFEQKIEFRQRITDDGSRKKRRSQIFARPFLNGADGKEHIHRPLASFAVAQSCHAVVAGGKHQVLKLVAFVHKEVVDAHHLKIGNVVFAVGHVVSQGFQLDFQIVLPYNQSFFHCP